MSETPHMVLLDHYGYRIVFAQLIPRLNNVALPLRHADHRYTSQ
jgi:hypothetical protein